VVANAASRAAASLAVLEEALAGKEYLLGEFSAADCMMGYTLLVARMFGVLNENYPNVAGYLGRLEARPAFQKAMRE
jgi:glutathione S-transferase